MLGQNNHNYVKINNDLINLFDKEIDLHHSFPTQAFLFILRRVNLIDSLPVQEKDIKLVESYWALCKAQGARFCFRELYCFFLLKDYLFSKFMPEDSRYDLLKVIMFHIPQTVSVYYYYDEVKRFLILRFFVIFFLRKRIFLRIDNYHLHEKLTSISKSYCIAAKKNANIVEKIFDELPHDVAFDKLFLQLMKILKTHTTRYNPYYPSRLDDHNLKHPLMLHQLKLRKARDLRAKEAKKHNKDIKII